MLEFVQEFMIECYYIYMFSLFSKKRIYLDNSGATPISDKARSALESALSVYGNPSAIHKEGDTASRALDKARAICANVLNAHAYEIYFAGSGTESCNMAIFGAYEAWKKDHKGDSNEIPHIITSSIEHPAVLEAVRFLEKKGKAMVTYLPVYEDGIVKAEDMKKAITRNTIIVSIMYANNEIGTIQPIKEIGRALDEWKTKEGLAHTAYPYFHIDACQATNYLSLDVVRLRAHLMTVNSSKCYGPKGVALLYKKEGVHLEPHTQGGGQERGLRSGTESVALAYSFAVALKETSEIKEQESKRLSEIRDFCKEELLRHIPEASIYGAWDVYNTHDGVTRKKEELRLPNNINCRIPNIPSDEMILRLDTKGFAVSHKSACASSETDGSYVIEALGKDKQEALENVRITLGRDTGKEDILSLVRAMKEIYSAFAKH